MQEVPAEEITLLRQCLTRTLRDLHALVHHPDNQMPETLEAEVVAQSMPAARRAVAEPHQEPPSTPAPRPRPLRRDRTDTVAGQLTRLEKQIKLILLATKAVGEVAVLEKSLEVDLEQAAKNITQAVDNTADRQLLTLLEEIAQQHDHAVAARKSDQWPPDHHPRE